APRSGALASPRSASAGRTAAAVRTSSASLIGSRVPRRRPRTTPPRRATRRSRLARGGPRDERRPRRARGGAPRAHVLAVAGEASRARRPALALRRAPRAEGSIVSPPAELLAWHAVGAWLVGAHEPPDHVPDAVVDDRLRRVIEAIIAV